MTTGAVNHERARELLRQTFCCDLHGCMPLRADDESFLPQLERYREAGVKLVFLNIGCDITSIEEHFRVLAHFRSWIRAHPDRYVLATDTATVAAAAAAGKLAVGFDIEGMNAIADQLSLVELYYDLGVRWMLIAYNKSNRVGGGCQDEDSGLTAYGRRVIAEMARVGMLLCCSHAGKRTALEAIDCSPNPVIFSHSNSAAVYAHPRNIDDDLIRACARRGGLIGINGLSRFLGAGKVDLSTFLTHLDHMVQLVGPEHVGVGLDFVFDTAEADAYIARFPQIYPPEQYRAGRTFVPPEALPAIVESLLDRGYPTTAIAAILGGNVLRIANAVWR